MDGLEGGFSKDRSQVLLLQLGYTLVDSDGHGWRR